MESVQPGEARRAPWPLAEPAPAALRESRGAVRARVVPAKSREERLALVLGWFSIGLGLAQVIAPRALCRAIGVPESPGIMRVFGLREIASGIGLLGTQRNRSAWLQGRVAGDAMDGVALAVAATRPGARGARILGAGAAVAGVAALDLYAARQYRERERRGATDVPARVEHAIAINRSPAECYRYWRTVENLPRFMTSLKSVQALDARRSHWVATGPADLPVEWESEIVAEEPDRFIAWATLPGADMPHAGLVQFEAAPGDRGTLVRVRMEYGFPGRHLGSAFARLFGVEPAQRMKEDMRRFKQLLETGEIATTVGQPAGRRSALARLLRKGLPG